MIVIPFVVGRVFTRGIGGEVFAYRPPDGACLACLEAKLERTQFREGIRFLAFRTSSISNCFRRTSTRSRS